MVNWEELQNEVDKIIENYKFNLNKIIAGKINFQIFKGLKIKYYDEMQEILDLCVFSNPEYRQIIIKPFDKSIVKDVYAAIATSQLKLDPINEGDKIRISLPEMSSERRKELVKFTNKYTEDAKIQIRNLRHNQKKLIKDLENVSEDQQRAFINDLQKFVDKVIEKINKLAQQKEESLMQI
ncbi:MAG: ribosome recycling factor [Mycoplasma sp.]|nr:ribosome recycling factor [Mycoplasma sp.]